MVHLVATLVFEGPNALEPELSFLEEVQRGLSSEPKRLSPKHLYDQRGSELFDAITRAPEYYLTRTELAIMRNHAGEMADAIGRGAQIVELGAGSTVKIRHLLFALEAPHSFVAVDISGEHLEASVAELKVDFPEVEITAVTGDFTRRFELPVSAGDDGPRRRVVYFPGSTIGNFDPRQAIALLEGVSRLLGVGGGLLIGTDLVKPVQVLQEAYDDQQGLTAQFILNVLHRMRDELGAEVDVEAFAYETVWQPEHERMHMRVSSTRDQKIVIDAITHALSKGERIHVEYSHKYRLEGFAELAARAGMSVQSVWTDPESRFAVQLLRVDRVPPKIEQ